MRVLNGLGLKNGRDVNSALNAISFPDRQRSPRRSFFASSKQTCNDGVLADTAAERRARDLTHPLQIPASPCKGTSGTLSAVTLQFRVPPREP